MEHIIRAFLLWVLFCIILYFITWWWWRQVTYVNPENENIYTILRKYGKLTGTVKKPLFSDRMVVKEILELQR